MELEEANRAWFKQNDLALALSLLDRLLERAPNDCGALNFAGWLRTTEGSQDFERGVGQLKAALALNTDDHRPAVNLAEALGIKGRAQEAVELIHPWCEAHPSAHFAWNSLGWLLGVVLHDEQAGLAALQRHSRFADARFNIGRIHLAARRIDQAEEFFSTALHCFRPHEAWLHWGEIHATRGHLRRALGAFRRAAELDRRAEYTQPLHQAITAIGNTLLQQQKYFLHAHDNSALSQKQETVITVRPPTLKALATRARELGDRPVERCAAEATLLPEFSDQLIGTGLEDWRAAHLELYRELLDREEAPPSALRSIIARRQWNEAFAALEAIDRAQEHGLLTVACEGERLGDRLHRLSEPQRAGRAWSLSEDAYSEYASYSSSGSEGMARMVDVNRLRTKRGLRPR